MRTELIIERLQKLAVKNYNKGWDTFVECYGQAEWLEFITNEDGSIMNLSSAKKLASDCASVWSERQADAAYHSRGGF